MGLRRPRETDSNNLSAVNFFLAFFFLRKIGPELTSAANPPLFPEEEWP